MIGVRIEPKIGECGFFLGIHCRIEGVRGSQCGQEVSVETESVLTAGCSEDPGPLWSSRSFFLGHLFLPLLSCHPFPLKPEAVPGTWSWGGGTGEDSVCRCAVQSQPSRPTPVSLDFSVQHL